MRIGRRVVALALVGSAVLAPPHPCRAQSATDSSRTGGGDANLAKAAQNPVANMVSLPLQWNYSTAGGLAANSALVLNVQPVLPLPVSDDWLIVSRTVVPFVDVPIPDSLPPSRIGGIGDIQEQMYYTKAKPGKITWGIGPIFSFPTATNDLVRTGQWGLGPTAVALVMPGPWVIGALVNNIWRIGGAANGAVLNTFTTQPFINYNLPHAWAISTSPLITSNWSAPEGQRWTVPIGLGVSKITHVGDQPMNLLLQYYHNLNHPSLAGSEELRLQIAALWPTAAAKEKEEKAKAAKDRESKDKKP